MEEEVRKKLKNFDDVLLLLNDMIRNIDSLMETMEYTTGGQDKAHKKSDDGYPGELTDGKSMSRKI